MTNRPPDDLNDDRFDAAWRHASREEPASALDDAIRAAARREVGARPQDVSTVREATRPERWWFPLAAAATIGAIAIGLLQLSTPERLAPTDDRRVVSDIPAGAKELPAPTEARPAPPTAALAKEQPPKTPVDKPKPDREAKQAKTPATPPGSAPAERRARQEPLPFPAPTRDNAPLAEQAPAPAPAPKKTEAAPESPVVAQSLPAGRAAPASPVAQSLPEGRAAPESTSEARATMKSRLAASAPAPSPDASNAAVAGAVAPAAPRDEAAAAPPPVVAAPPMAAPQRAATKLAADRVDSVEARAKERAALPLADWISMMRRLRDERRFDELAKELAAFRSLHADANALLPQDLRDLALPPAR